MFKWLVQFFHNLFQIQVQTKGQKNNLKKGKVLSVKKSKASNAIKGRNKKSIYDELLYNISSDRPFCPLRHFEIFKLSLDQRESIGNCNSSEVRIFLLDASSPILKYPKFCNEYFHKKLDEDTTADNIIRIMIQFDSKIKLYSTFLIGDFQFNERIDKRSRLYDSIYILLVNLVNEFGSLIESQHIKFNFTLITNGDDDSGNQFSYWGISRLMKSFRRLSNWNFDTIGFDGFNYNAILNMGFPLGDNHSFLSKESMNIFEKEFGSSGGNVSFINEGAKRINMKSKLVPSSSLDKVTSEFIELEEQDELSEIEMQKKDSLSVKKRYEPVDSSFIDIIEEIKILEVQKSENIVASRALNAFDTNRFCMKSLVSVESKKDKDQIAQEALDSFETDVCVLNLDDDIANQKK